MGDNRGQLRSADPTRLRRFAPHRPIDAPSGEKRGQLRWADPVRLRRLALAGAHSLHRGPTPPQEKKRCATRLALSSFWHTGHHSQRRFTITPDFNLGVNASREGLIEKKCSILPKK